MKKRLGVSLLFLIFVALLSGCGLLPAEEGEHRERLTVAEWPTPAPTQSAPTPTPFPRQVLVPATATPAATPVVTTAKVTAAETPAVEGIDLGQSGAAFVEQIRSLSGGAALPPSLAPVAIGIVAVDQAGIYSGPGASAGVIETVEQGELAGILGKDNSGSWVYVITIKKTLGWLHVGSLRVTGNLAELPVLPANPLAAFMAQFSAAAPAGGSSNSAGSSGAAKPVQPLAVRELTPVTTAQVKSELLNIRQRPGGSYPQLFTLPRDSEVAVLALNRDGRWALVETANGQVGWASADFLSFSGSLAGAPMVRTLEPTNTTEVAPIVALSGASETDAAAAAAANTPPVAAPAAGTPPAAPEVNVPPAVAPADVSPPILPGQTLAPVASAKVKIKSEARRGPGDRYGAVDELTVDLAVEILAQNKERDWVVVRTPLGSVGWVRLEALAVEGGAVADAPQVVTAWIESNETELRAGPGIYYDSTGKLAIYDMVSVLALNPGRNWALIEALNGGRGWLPLRLMEVTGSLAGLPEIEAEALAENAPAGPELPAANAASTTTGKLVIQSSSGGEIYMINADGSGLRYLTHGIDPVLSPDGQQVAFTRWQGETGALWVINVDGSGERHILGEMRQAKGPDWSPDGSQIVLNFQYGGRLDENVVCRPLSDTPTPPRNALRIWVKTNSQGVPTDLCWALTPDPHWGLRVIDVADGSFEDMYGGTYAFRPAWDPQQPWRIVSDSGNGLLDVSTEQKDFRQPLTDVLGDGSPVFSPDGRFLAIVTQLQNAHDIYRLNSDGSGRVRLTETPLWVPVQAENNGKLWHNVAPAWSPDGSSIAFLTDRTGRWEIWVMNADGSNQRALFSEGVNNQLQLSYEFVDERVLSWR